MAVMVAVAVNGEGRGKEGEEPPPRTLLTDAAAHGPTCY